MFTLVLASMMASASTPARVEASSLKGQPTRYCREMGSAASRNQAIVICRTRAQWQRMETCQGATRYCAPRKRDASATGLPGRPTAFALNEDSRIVCRTVKATGSRLRASSVCLPIREWDRMWKESAETAFKAQDMSTRPTTAGQ